MNLYAQSQITKQLALATRKPVLPFWKAGVQERLASAVMDMSEGAQTVVRSAEGDSRVSDVNVGLYQKSESFKIYRNPLEFKQLLDV